MSNRIFMDEEGENKSTYLLTEVLSDLDMNYTELQLMDFKELEGIVQGE